MVVESSRRARSELVPRMRSRRTLGSARSCGVSKGEKDAARHEGSENVDVSTEMAVCACANPGSGSRFNRCVLSWELGNRSLLQQKKNNDVAALGTDVNQETANIQANTVPTTPPQLVVEETRWVATGALKLSKPQSKRRPTAPKQFVLTGHSKRRPIGFPLPPSNPLRVG